MRNDYLLLMHNDVPESRRLPDEAWGVYLAGLRESGALQGGSSIGDGVCMKKEGPAPEITRYLGGYIKVRAASLEDARQLVVGNPVYEGGGTVEVRELPKD
ncbi:MAG: YciI family protein [Candidatus Eisenbacteria bacterium]